MILAFLISTYFMVTNRNLYYYVTTDRNNCPLTCLLKQASCLARLHARPFGEIFSFANEL